MTQIDLGRQGFILLEETLRSLRMIIDADMRVAVGHVGVGQLSLSEIGDGVLVRLDETDIVVLSPADYRGGWRWRHCEPGEHVPTWFLDLDPGRRTLVGIGPTVQEQATALPRDD